MTDEEKIRKATELIERMNRMSFEDVAVLMEKHCGEALGLFMMNYATKAMARKFTIDNAQSLIVMGYLIRANEESGVIFQGSALA